eukprot:15497-Heterococcus_DN1.PRE.1
MRHSQLALSGYLNYTVILSVKSHRTLESQHTQHMSTTLKTPPTVATTAAYIPATITLLQPHWSNKQD